MGQHLVIKKKNHVLTLEAAKVNLKRARLIASHPHDRYAKYLIAEVVEEVDPRNTIYNETGESIQEASN